MESGCAEVAAVRADGQYAEPSCSRLCANDYCSVEQLLHTHAGEQTHADDNHYDNSSVHGSDNSPARRYPPGSILETLKPLEIIHHHPVFVKDTSKFWYKPTISREDAIAILKDKPAGTFLVRDSNSFPGAFGLALKVDKPPAGVEIRPGNEGNELVRHFLIEPTKRGVKLKGCNNEPVFGSLAALVYQHSVTPLALPVKLVLPEFDPVASTETNDQGAESASQLLAHGAACNVTYILTCDTESLTGPEALRRAVDRAFMLLNAREIQPTSAHFKVSSSGITVTDNTRKLFFRRHYPTATITFCGVDPEDRRWQLPAAVPAGTAAVREARLFGFVARKSGASTTGPAWRPSAENACHVFAELEPEQPASAIVNFVTKVLLGPIGQQQQPQQKYAL